MINNKPLFGIAGTKNHAARNARRFICEGVNLLHTNIKQPVFAALAEQTHLSEFELEHHVDLYRKLPTHEYSAIELYHAIEVSMLSQDENALITAASDDMASKNIIINYANGYLLSGIDTDAEAAWVRKQGGVVIHLIDKSCPHATPSLYIDPSDFITSVSNRDCACSANIKSLINRLLRLVDRSEAA